jgi:hypothetical protein
MSRTEDKLIALAERVRAKRLSDPAKIGVAPDRILRDSGVQQCVTTHIAKGVFTWDYTEERVGGHVAICVLTATIEAVMAKDLASAKSPIPTSRTR